MWRSIFCCCREKIPDNLNPKDLPLFIPPLKTGKVIKVYDGDTITIASRVPGLYNSPIYKTFNIYTISIFLFKIIRKCFKV